MMEVQTLTVLAGTMACNARCPYCISRMTPAQGLEKPRSAINWRNFRKACLLAQKSGVNTILISGKGEPTLCPDEITNFLKELERFQFPIIELQTNGLLLDEKYKDYEKCLEEWYKLGLTMIAISVTHYQEEKNRGVFTSPKKYINLERLIRRIHSIGFSVRLSCVMVKGQIDSPKKVVELLEFAKANNVEQVTARPVNNPAHTEDREVCEWVKGNSLSAGQKKEINRFFERNAAVLMKYSYGATVYDYKGQNICITNSLTINLEGKCIRQLIFFPDGHLRYDWQYKGATIL